MSDIDDMRDVFGDEENFVIEGVLQWIVRQEMLQEREICDQVDFRPHSMNTETTEDLQPTKMPNPTLPQYQIRRPGGCYKKFRVYSSKWQRHFESPIWAEGVLEVLAEFIFGLGKQTMTIALAEKLAIDCNIKRKEKGSRGEEITAKQAQQWIWNERKRSKAKNI